MACHNYDGDMLTDEVAQVRASRILSESSMSSWRNDKGFPASPFYETLKKTMKTLEERCTGARALSPRHLTRP